MPYMLGPDVLPRHFQGGVGTGPDMVLHVTDDKPSSTDGGTFTAGDWRTRTLNTVKVNNIGASLAANQVTLQAGTYDIHGHAAAYVVSQNKLRLQNITDGTTALLGMRSFAGGDAVANTAHIIGRITIAAAKAFELQHRSDGTRANDGFGTAVGVGLEDERYAELWIEKVA